MTRDGLGAVWGERLLVFVAGTKLVRYADQIVELIGLGQLWIGAVPAAGAPSLQALTTSQPARMTALGAVLMSASTVIVPSMRGC